MTPEAEKELAEIRQHIDEMYKPEWLRPSFWLIASGAVLGAVCTIFENALPPAAWLSAYGVSALCLVLGLTLYLRYGK